MDKARYYMLWTLGAGALSVLILYVEFQAVQAALESGEWVYRMPKYKATLFGSAAVVAHLATIGIAILFGDVAIKSYRKFREL